ncbi:hypothetical protein GF336_00655 [Candidatus Woesearchaeota archaeon]|nr:hypothetical protein [Candidatus Woesearchaeota archaeon]
MDLEDFLQELEKDIEIKDSNGKNMSVLFPNPKNKQKTLVANGVYEFVFNLKDYDIKLHLLAQSYLAMAALVEAEVDIEKQVGLYHKNICEEIGLFEHFDDRFNLLKAVSKNYDMNPSRKQRRYVKEMIMHGPEFLKKVYAYMIVPAFDIRV